MKIRMIRSLGRNRAKGLITGKELDKYTEKSVVDTDEEIGNYLIGCHLAEAVTSSHPEPEGFEHVPARAETPVTAQDESEQATLENQADEHARNAGLNDAETQAQLDKQAEALKQAEADKQKSVAPRSLATGKPVEPARGKTEDVKKS